MRQYKSEGVILKRINYGEADRIVTIYTKQYGKVSAIAKSVRKMQSKKRGSLEPGTQGMYYFVKGRSLDILTETQIISNFYSLQIKLNDITKLYQLLEFVDILSPDLEPSPIIYDVLTTTLLKLEQNQIKKHDLVERYRFMLKEMGYTYDKVFSELGLKNYIEELAGRSLRSKAYLTIPSQSLQ